MALQNFKSDFIIFKTFSRETDGEVIDVPVPGRLELVYFVDGFKSCYKASRKGDECINCSISEDGMSLSVYLKLSEACLGPGRLLEMMTEYIEDDTFPGGFRKVQTVRETEITLWTGNGDGGIVSEDAALLSKVAYGYSAYQLAVRNGFEGTEKEWLDSLIGTIATEHFVDVESEQTITALKKFTVAPIMQAGMSMSNTRIHSVGNPISDDDAANKSYVDTIGVSLEEKIDTKQDTLNPGRGISIDQATKTISCTLDTTIFKVVDSLPTAPASGDENKIHLVLSSSSEEGNTYDEYLWTNDSWERIGSFRPSVDLSRYAEKSYVDSQIKGEATARTKADAELQTQINRKQEALTLTVKDNGNIVLANIQGQSKEFMPATPSGDPMHYAYVAAGAEYNDTGADIVKTAPWADMIDDDYTGEYGKTVVHKAGYWYLNGLGDITNEEIRRMYQLTSAFPESLYIEERFKGLPIRTNFFSNKSIGGWGSALISALIYANYSIISFAFTEISAVSGNFHTFAYTSVRHIIGTIFSLQSSTSTFEGSTITSVKINRLRINLSIPSPNLSCKSVLYMINNEAATSAITITLHADVYNRCMANADILAALEAHTNVSLASA